MKQIDLAEKSGVTQQFISMVLKGDRRPNYATAKLWESITGILIDDWMTAPAEDLREAFEAAQGQEQNSEAA